MRIPSGKTDQSIFFVAVDATDKVTRETGLSGFTVYRSRNGAAAAAYTTPTVAEVDATNMPGVYALLLDEDTTIAAGSDSEEYCVHISKTGMASVTRTIELYRGSNADVLAIKAKTDNLPTDPADASVIAGRFDTLDTNISVVAGYLDTEIAGIKAKTDNLPANPAASSDIPSANANADALLDRADGIEVGYTLRATMRVMSAVLGGKSSGHPGTPVYRNLPDSADRVSATVSSGNRTAVTLTP